MRILKLGGSLSHGGYLRQWLVMLARQQGLIVVPGGGPFADQVRSAQQRWGFTDLGAHQMALLAMEQYGVMLCDLQPGLVPVATQAGIDEALATGKTPVWLPRRMLEGATLARDWSVTSDSLALWLAQRLQAQALILIKSIQPRTGFTPMVELIADGIVDPAFAGMLSAGSPAGIFWAGSQQIDAVDDFLRGHGSLLAPILA